VRIAPACGYNVGKISAGCLVLLAINVKKTAVYTNVNGDM